MAEGRERLPKFKRSVFVWIQTDEPPRHIFDVPALCLLAEKRLSHGLETSRRFVEKPGLSEPVLVHFWCTWFLVH